MSDNQKIIEAIEQAQAALTTAIDALKAIEAEHEADFQAEARKVTRESKLSARLHEVIYKTVIQENS